ncbi:HTH-type transcriptional regulator HdfR [Levilactobacillus brevis]|nr:HTH-type transcriptional regulator HdfR [Levilactobacillus brevis]QCZ51705.1 Transcriptional regulator [Levilactobacillus brevis]
MLPFAYRVFQAIVQEQTFYRAAQTLNVTPSAISHSVNQLEKELGFPLFIRNRTGVELTPDGQSILPLIQGVINAEDRLQQAAANINGLNAGSVRLGAFSSVCITWLPPSFSSSNKLTHRLISTWFKPGSATLPLPLRPDVWTSDSLRSPWPKS